MIDYKHMSEEEQRIIDNLWIAHAHLCEAKENCFDYDAEYYYPIMEILKKQKDY